MDLGVIRNDNLGIAVHYLVQSRQIVQPWVVKLDL